VARTKIKLTKYVILISSPGSGLAPTAALATCYVVCAVWF